MQSGIQSASLVLSRLGLLLNLFDRIAAASVALLFYPRFASTNIMLSHRKQKHLPYMVVVIDFLSDIVVNLKYLLYQRLSHLHTAIRSQFWSAALATHRYQQHQGICSGHLSWPAKKNLPSYLGEFSFRFSRRDFGSALIEHLSLSMALSRSTVQKSANIQSRGNLKKVEEK